VTTDARRFFARVALFLAPVAAVLGAGELLLWRSGEAAPAAWVLDAQARDPSRLYLRGFLDQQFWAYKYEAVLRRRPRVLALGSSRAMQFRAEMFGTDGPSFYNGGGMVQSIADLATFARRLPAQATQRVVLLGIDHFWLSEGVADTDNLGPQIDGRGVTAALTDASGHLAALRALLRRPDLVRDELHGLGDARNVGLAARHGKGGFRFDGSYDYALPVPAGEAGWRFQDREQPPIPRRIRDGIRQFARTSGLSEARLGELRQALVVLKNRGILVAGYLPPLSADARRALAEVPAQAALWDAARQRVPALFAELGLPLVDASGTELLGLDDRAMIDGLHALETFHARLLLRLLDDPRLRDALPTAGATVQAALASPRTNPWYPGY
jgi:hypothetical protein